MQQSKKAFKDLKVKETADDKKDDNKNQQQVVEVQVAEAQVAEVQVAELQVPVLLEKEAALSLLRKQEIQ